MNTNLTPFRTATPLRGRRWLAQPFGFADFGRMFDEFWSQTLPEAAVGPIPELSPSVDVADTGNAYRISAELPGLGEDDVEILIQDDTLTLKGEKRAAEETKTANGGFVRERRFGAFERRFRLPADVAADKVDARFDKGVLTIDLPKAETAPSAKKIRINAN